MSSDTYKNTRKYPRHDAVFRISYRDVRQLVDYTENLSEEGVFIATEKQFEPGSEIVFELSFPGLVKPIRLTGTVMWRRPPESLDEIRPPGIGVLLKFGSDIERTWLRDLLYKLTDKHHDDTRTTPDDSYLILLAEDNQLSRSMFQQALSESNRVGGANLSIVESDSPVSTRNVLAGQQVDLMIIEWRMCPTNKSNLLEELRAMPEWNAPTVLVLGGTEEEGRQAMAAGADAFLRRPVPAKGLIHTVRSLLSQRSQTRQP